MKRKINLLLTIILIFFCGHSLSALKPTNITSPSLNCDTMGVLLKDNKVTYHKINFKHTDNIININSLEMSNKEGFIPIGNDEKVFVVVYDDVSKDPIVKRYLAGSGNKYSGRIILPCYCDVVFLRFYRQEINEPYFTIKEENFIGSFKTRPVNNIIYEIGGETPLKTLDKEGNILKNGEEFFFRSLTPNYYGIRVYNYTEYLIAKIVLPKEQEHLLSEKEKIFQNYSYNLDENTTIGENIFNPNVPSKKRSIMFYLPKEVLEFKLLVYYISLTNQEKDIYMQYNIKLNRKINFKITLAHILRWGYFFIYSGN